MHFREHSASYGWWCGPGFQVLSDEPLLFVLLYLCICIVVIVLLYICIFNLYLSVRKPMTLAQKVPRVTIDTRQCHRLSFCLRIQITGDSVTTLQNVMKGCFILTQASLNTEFIVSHKDVAKWWTCARGKLENWSLRFGAKLKNVPITFCPQGRSVFYAHPAICRSISPCVGTTYICASCHVAKMLWHLRHLSN